MAYDCIVTAERPDNGYRGLDYIRLGYEIPRAIIVKNKSFEHEEPVDVASRIQTTWFCDYRDRLSVVEEVSRNFTGWEIKVFKLAEAHERVPGDLVSKVVDESGVLPA